MRGARGSFTFTIRNTEQCKTSRREVFPRLFPGNLLISETHDRAYIASIINSFRRRRNTVTSRRRNFPEINMRRETMMPARAAHNDNLSSVILLKIEQSDSQAGLEYSTITCLLRK